MVRYFLPPKATSLAERGPDDRKLLMTSLCVLRRNANGMICSDATDHMIVLLAKVETMVRKKAFGKRRKGVKVHVSVSSEGLSMSLVLFPAMSMGASDLLNSGDDMNSQRHLWAKTKACGCPR